MRATKNERELTANDEEHLERVGLLLKTAKATPRKLKELKIILGKIVNKRLLLTYQIEFNSKQTTLLLLAISLASYQSNNDFLEVLLAHLRDAGIDINETPNGMPLLFAALSCHSMIKSEILIGCEMMAPQASRELELRLLPLINKLLEYGVNPDPQFELTLLSLAVRIGAFNFCSALLKTGRVNYDRKDKNNLTALHYLALRLVREVLFEISGKQAVYTVSDAKYYICKWACENDTTAYADKYKNHVVKPGVTDEKIVQAFLIGKYNKNEQLNNLLAERISTCNTSSSIIILKLLLDSGAGLTAGCTEEILTPIAYLLALNNERMNGIMLAYCRDQKRTFQELSQLLEMIISFKSSLADDLLQLIKARFFTTLSAQEKGFLLVLASHRRHYELVAELIDAQADHSVTDRYANTALHHLLWQFEINTPDQNEKAVVLIEKLVAAGAVLTARNAKKLTAVDQMSKLEDTRLESLLRQYCTNEMRSIAELVILFKELKSNNHALTTAIFDLLYTRLIVSDQPQELALLLQIAVMHQSDRVAEIIAAGADIHYQGDEGTPLYIAVYCRNVSAMEQLLQAKADPNLGRKQHAPLALAVQNEDFVAMNLLASSETHALNMHQLTAKDANSAPEFTFMSLAVHSKVSSEVMVWLVEREGELEEQKETLNSTVKNPLCQAVRAFVSEEYFRNILKRIGGLIELTTVDKKISPFVLAFLQETKSCLYQHRYIQWFCDYVYAEVLVGNANFTTEQLHLLLKAAMGFAKNLRDEELMKHINHLSKGKNKFCKEKEREKEKEINKDPTNEVNEELERDVSNFIQSQTIMSARAYLSHEYDAAYVSELFADIKEKHKQQKRENKSASENFAGAGLSVFSKAAPTWFNGRLRYEGEDTQTLKQIKGAPNCYLWIPIQWLVQERCPKEDMELFLKRKAKFDHVHIREIKGEQHEQSVLCHGVTYENLISTHELKLPESKSRLLIYKMPMTGEASLYIALRHLPRGLHRLSDVNSMRQSERPAFDLTQSLPQEQKAQATLEVVAPLGGFKNN